MYQITTESVSEGHPDKVADLISDRVADFLINKDLNNRAAIETLVTTNMVTLAGEYKSNCFSKSKIENIVRDVIQDIGYEQEGFHWQNVKIYNELHGQSPDIALGTDDFGAGDQGIMFGYACQESPEHMPLGTFYAHKILKQLADNRKNNPSFEGILPDSKCQITVNNGVKNQPIDFATVLVSTQHTDALTQSKIEDLVIQTIYQVVPLEYLTYTVFKINPTGRFVIGGPDGDTGLTGRKIVVDTYGGYAPHGGGAFSGKDGTKVDRSGAYMARWIAKNIVEQKGYKECQVQLSYIIGQKEPESLVIFTDGKINYKLIDFVNSTVDLTPKGILEKFELGSKIKFTETTNYGHFGRIELPWEYINL